MDTDLQSPFNAGAVVYAKDISRMGQFYSEVVGLPVVKREQNFVLLQSPAFQITVVAMPPPIATQVPIASPPIQRENAAIKLCFSVSSIEFARAAAKQFGGLMNEPEREWEFQGMSVCDGHDPEGNVIQVRAGLP